MWKLLTGITVFVLTCSTVANAADKESQARVHWFEYAGQDEVFSQSRKPTEFYNPVLAGFYPDPSITRKGNDYYLTHSSFAYTPGLPIFHSTDLINWKFLGHALTEKNKIDMNDLGVSRGIFAPTIRYHDGLFYIITTAVDAGGNFIITAKDPAGPWSEPHWLPEVGGIDPDIFFDENGKAYISHNDEPPHEPLYDGHRAVWMWEYDLAAKKVVEGSRKLLVNGGTNLSEKPVWIEGPHIYQKNGWYYLICAEGGTSIHHSVVIFRTRSLDQPFEPYENNPILTQRDLPLAEQKISSVGHADLIQSPEGEWWAVFLGTRPYSGNFYNTGRETHMLPVTWENDWPHILPRGVQVPTVVTSPDETEVTPSEELLNGNGTWRDDFDDGEIHPFWLSLKRFERRWVKEDKGALHLQPQGELAAMPQPSVLLRRQQHKKFTATAAFDAPSEQLTTGMVAYQNEGYFYYFGLERKNSELLVFVNKTQSGEETRVASATIKASPSLELKIEGNKDTLKFWVKQTQWQQVGDTEDATILSTEKAGGFVGAMVGVYAGKVGE